MPASFKVSFQIIFFSVHGVFPKGGGLQKGEGYIEIADTLLLIGIASIGKSTKMGVLRSEAAEFPTKSQEKRIAFAGFYFLIQNHFSVIEATIATYYIMSLFFLMFEKYFWIQQNSSSISEEHLYCCKGLVGCFVSLDKTRCRILFSLNLGQ